MAASASQMIPYRMEYKKRIEIIIRRRVTATVPVSIRSFPNEAGLLRQSASPFGLGRRAGTSHCLGADGTRIGDYALSRLLGGFFG
jgi:hypothetical protein